MAGCRPKLVTLKTGDGVVHDSVLNKYMLKYDMCMELILHR